MLSIETLAIAVSWFSMVWFASAALMLIVVQALLPRAWEQVRAHPPHGPQWAYTLWYQRERVYGALMAVALLLGAIAALVYLVL